MSEARIRALEQQIEQMREENYNLRIAASQDVQNLQTDLVKKNREIAKLKADRVKSYEDSPEHKDITQLLSDWRDLTGRTSRVYIGADGDRYKLARTTVKRYGIERARKALLDGLAKHPYAGPRGRSSVPYPGSKEWAEVSHAFSDDERFTRCEELADNPVAIGAEPEKKAVPQDSMNERRWADKGSADPCGDFLGALRAAGFDYRNAGRTSWRAQCPAHGGEDMNLSVMQEPAEGNCKLKCWSRGCSTTDILDAVGLPHTALFRGTGTRTLGARLPFDGDQKAFNEAYTGEKHNPDLGMAA